MIGIFAGRGDVLLFAALTFIVGLYVGHVLTVKAQAIKAWWKARKG